MAGVTQRLEAPSAGLAVGAPKRDGGANGALGALLGAVGMAMAAALVVAVVGATGGIRSVTTAAPAASAAPAAALPAAGASGTQGTRQGSATAPAAIQPAKAVTVPTIARSAAEVPPAITRSAPATVRVDLETKEVTAEITKGETYSYMTFGGSVPGPMLRVRVGDTVELHLKNAADSKWPHSIDLHAVSGPGGGAVATQTAPGKESVIRFKALNPGLFVYHCASAPIPMHVIEGMYGLILVEPEGGLPKVDREYYVMQAELYTNAPKGTAGQHEFDQAKMDNETPDYVVMNGTAGGLTGDNAMKAKVGETVRVYFGVGGFLPSSLHIIGDIFDRVYPEGGATLNTNVQTTLVPAGGAAMVELKFDVPGTYTLLDHSLPRAIDKGGLAQIVVTGDADPSIYSSPTASK